MCDVVVGVVVMVVWFVVVFGFVVVSVEDYWCCLFCVMYVVEFWVEKVGCEELIFVVNCVYFVGLLLLVFVVGGIVFE